MKLILVIVFFAIVVCAPGSVHALSMTIDGVAVGGTFATTGIIPTGTYGDVSVSGFQGRAPRVVITDGANSDTMKLTDIVITQINAASPVVIQYQHTFSTMTVLAQSFQVVLSGVFSAPTGNPTTGDSVSLTGNVQFSGAVSPSFIGAISQTVGSNLVGATQPLRSGPFLKSCPTAVPCTDTLFGSLSLNMGVADSFTMSGSAGVDECDTTEECTSLFNEEFASWQELRVPEPASLLLVFSGLGVFFLAGKKYRFFK